MLYKGYFPSKNLGGYSSTGYQMTVPPKTFWHEQTNSSWSTSTVNSTRQLTGSANNIQTQTSSVEMNPDIFAPSLTKKQNNNNLIDLNFFDGIENPKESFANVSTSVLEAFDPLLFGQSVKSSSDEVDQGKDLF